ncbi:hypothetical protein [Kurthia sibirica]|uniref:Uncharacterized protein n=1 Tax=Kurthia sibirica TaxID=202750 RepID=A0A2U3AKA3_9BACL|nr:hypothetical protein [Kurthia sibirica]PWI24970.1 hypothetical protein DEX24_10370 [Kurthia sibirica]
MANVSMNTRRSMKKKKDTKTKKDKLKDILMSNHFLKKITPEVGYHFSSDYFMIDDNYATILTVFNTEGSDDNLGAMWGINMIPRNLGEGVVTRQLTYVNQAEQKWVEKYQGKADDNVKSEVGDSQSSNQSKTKLLTEKKSRDLTIIAEDLASGDSYLYVSFKLLIKATKLKNLEEAVDRITREFDTNFGGVYLAPFEGRQQEDFKNLTKRAEDQIGRNYMFTATEFAGFYNIVTHGIEDVRGEYVGQMRADVNNAAVLWDMNDYDSHVIVAADNKAVTLGHNESYFGSSTKASTLWGVKLSQSALLNNKRVVHFVLNGADVTKIGVNLSSLTSMVSMSNGDINPFEMFGDSKDELGIYAAHLEKIRLMTQQMSRDIDDIALNILVEQLNLFYIGHKMWVRNAMENREKIRIVGIPHNNVPRLRKFSGYLDNAYSSYLSMKNVDPNVTRSLAGLSGLFKSMLESNGDLFDTITSNNVDSASIKPRVIYDFSSLMMRGTGVVMAQFINALGFATSSLKEGDVVIIHGADRIDEGILQYTKRAMDDLRAKKVRVAYLYDDTDKMLENTKLNSMAKADWILTGYMSVPAVQSYQEALSARIPETLRSAILSKNDTQYYLRRGLDNIIFDSDLLFD